MLPQLEGHPTESKSREERKTLGSGTIGTEGFFWRWGECWEKRSGQWGMMENGTQKECRWDMRRGQLYRKDVKERELGELGKGKCHEQDGRAELGWGLGRHKIRSHQG